MSRICSRCKVEKDESEFNNDSSRSSGLAYVCRECYRHRSTWIKKTKEHYPEGYAKCSRCNCVKLLEEFARDSVKKNGRKSWCRECFKEHYVATRDRQLKICREYRQNNKQKRKESQKKYAVANQEKILAYRNSHRREAVERAKKWKEKNTERNNKVHATRVRQRRLEDACFRIKSVLRKRLRGYLGRRYKHCSQIGDLNCSIYELRTILEKQFQAGMSWDNYGTLWHIDHIIPFMWLDMSQYAHQRLVCHYKNLRPLNASENLSRDYTDIEDYPELIGLAFECCC